MTTTAKWLGAIALGVLAGACASEAERPIGEGGEASAPRVAAAIDAGATSGRGGEARGDGGGPSAPMGGAARDAGGGSAGGGEEKPIEAGPSTAMVSDDFEASALGSVWTVRGFEGNQAATPTTAQIDSTRAHRGARSVHVTDGFLEAKTTSATFYVRAWGWFDKEPGDGHWMNVVALGPGGAQGTEVRYGGHFGILEANYFGNDDEVISDPKGYCSPTCTNGVTLPVRRWTCLEAFFGKDEIALSVDGTPIETLHVKGWRNKTAPWSPAYDRVRIGFHNFQGGSVDSWYDDVIVDTKPIGCAR